jgi:hypothetical protein
VHGGDGRIGKGPGIKPGRVLGVSIVPKANRVLCWLRHVTSPIEVRHPRTINTDSLYHLYHVMLLATEPVPIMSLLHCEKCRLGWKYGIEPTLAAEARMYDTLFTPAEHKMAHEKDDQLVITPAQQMTLGVGPKRCGPLGPLRPDTADGRCSEQSIRSRCDRERPDVGRRRLRRRWCGRCYRIEI